MAALAAAALSPAAARAGSPGGSTPELVPLGGIAVPRLRARLLARLPLGPSGVAAVAFGADVVDGSRDLLALVSEGQVMALEPLSWQGEDGSRLYTGVSALPDRRRLRLRRSASAPLGHSFRHEEWTDYLLWQDRRPLADAPVRPVLAASWQALLAGQRATVIAALRSRAWTAVDADLLAFCAPPRFPPVGSY